MAKNAPKRQEPVAGKRAAIYARVSDKSQDGEDKTSISEQINDMESYCESKGLTITARYQEVGRGWSKKRPEFQRMLADARKGRFDVIVCWKSGRHSDRDRSRAQNSAGLPANRLISPKTVPSCAICPIS